MQNINRKSLEQGEGKWELMLNFSVNLKHYSEKKKLKNSFLLSEKEGREGENNEIQKNGHMKCWQRCMQ